MIKNLARLGIFCFLFLWGTCAVYAVEGSWNVQLEPFDSSAYFSSIIFTDENIGFATGYINNESKYIIFKTEDGGIHWDELYSPSFHGSSHSYFVDQFTGWAVGDKILHTTNGGLDWKEQKIPNDVPYTYLYDVHFINRQIGWTVGQGKTILKTYDGGNNWYTQMYEFPSTSHYGVFFIDENEGWVVGNDGILHTTDGGIKWNVQLSNNSFLNDLYFIDSKTGWVVGVSGTIWNTTDGGNNWSQQDSGTTQTLSAVHFIDNKVGWVVGGTSPNEDSIILHTIDGGNNWFPQQTNITQYLRDVYFIGEKGWTAGQYGVILGFTSDTSPEPIPDIKANNSDGPITIPQGDQLTITIALAPNDRDGEKADWWIKAESPLGRYWYKHKHPKKWIPSLTPIRAYGGPLFDLSPSSILDISSLSIGEYDFEFSVDDNQDGQFDSTYSDSVLVTVE